MAKRMDITDKLSFDENPYLVIKGQEFEVNADAKTVIEIMDLFRTKSDVEAAMDAYRELFSKEDREILEGMMPLKDLMVVIRVAMELVQGGEEDNGGE